MANNIDMVFIDFDILRKKSKIAVSVCFKLSAMLKRLFHMEHIIYVVTSTIPKT